MIKSLISYFLIFSIAVTNSYAGPKGNMLHTMVTAYKQEHNAFAFKELQNKAESLKQKDVFVLEIIKHFPEHSKSREKFLEAVSEVKDSPFKDATFESTATGGQIHSLKNSIEIDFENEVIIIAKKAYSFKNKSADTVFMEWLKDYEGIKTSSFSFSIIEDAHAVLPLVYVAIVLVVAAAVVVTKVTASSINHYRNLSCERKVQLFQSTLQTKANTCELNLNQFANTPSLLSQALIFKKNYKGKPGETCKNSVLQNKEFMKKDVFLDPVTCVSDEMAVQICKKLKEVEACGAATSKAINDSDRSTHTEKGSSSSNKNFSGKKSSKQ